MIKRFFFHTLITSAAIMAMMTVPVAAAETPAVFTTPDNVLSIEAPTSQWQTVKDSSFWFEMTDGDCRIAISHLSNGEALPAQEVAADSKEAVLQSLISTRNEVFVVTASSGKKEHLQDLIKAVGSIRILIYDTKTAVKAAPKSEAAKQIKVYALSGAETVITLGEDGQWRDKDGVIFYNTVDTMYYEDHNKLFWNSDPNYWKEREAEGITTWVTVYSADGASDEIGLGLDNVWRNHNNEEYAFDTVDTYIGPDGAVWALNPGYWGSNEDVEEDIAEDQGTPEAEIIDEDAEGELEFEYSEDEEFAEDWDMEYADSDLEEAE